MRVLSNHLNFRLTVRPEVIQQGQDDRSVLRTYAVVTQLDLQFKREGLSGEEMQFAMRHFMRGQPIDPTDVFSHEAWGAHPDTRDGALGGRIYRAWDPRQQFSVFDTASLGGQDRVDAEAFFERQPESQDWVVFKKVALKAPWPTYEEMQWKKIGPTARELGLVAEAALYEQSREEPREGVLKALLEEHTAAVVEAEEDAALSVIIP